MGLIIGKKIKSLKKGYPTVSDKYDVAPAVLTGDTAVLPGEAVMYTESTGLYKAVSNAEDVSKIAGILLATNVKMPTRWPSDGKIETVAGEAFNLCFRGHLAVEIEKANLVDADLVEGAKIGITLADGKFTTSSKIDDLTVVAIGEYEGVVETEDTSTAGNVLVAIRIDLHA